MSDGHTAETDANDQDARQGIQSVEVGARILDSLAAGTGPMTLGEVAAGAGLQPSKVHRYLISMIRIGFASQSSVSGRYDLGPALRRIGAESLRRTNEVAVASEAAGALRDETGHSVNLSVWGDDAPIIVRWDYGSHALPLSLRVGTRLPLLDSATGRVFLTHLPSGMTEEALGRAQDARLERLDEAAVEALKESVRALGAGTISGALIPGASAVSAPIFTASDSLPLVMTLVLPGERLESAAIDEAVGVLTAACRRVSRELGTILD